MAKQMETTAVYWDYTRMIEKTKESTVVYRGYIGILENANYYSITLVLNLP